MHPFLNMVYVEDFLEQMDSQKSMFPRSWKY